jgi:hypothetical protein
MSDVTDSHKIFERLQNIKSRRLEMPADSVHRMQNACKNLPTEYKASHGYHRDCYQKFTKNLDRLQKPNKTLTEPCTSTHASRSNQPDNIIFNNDCIFCKKTGRKKIKVKCIWTTEATSKFEFGGGDTVQQIAEEKGDEDLLKRIRGFDLFACEAQFHQSCRRQYICNHNPSKWRSENEKERTKQLQLEEAHMKAFANVCCVIDEHVIGDLQVAKLSGLCQIYISRLEDTEFPNADYRGEKLKVKLEKYYGDKLSFTPLDSNDKFRTLLVYSSQIDVGTAVKCSYELGTMDMMGEAARFLRKTIIESFNKGNALPWPPTAHQLVAMGDVTPSHLKTFLSIMISGKECTDSGKINRLVYSIGQDICRAATNGKWKLPKHILICLTLRHLFRSAELTTLINRLGHSESYSFSLELETALAIALQKSSSLLSTQIIRNPNVPSLFHSDFDNFDQLVNCLTGSGSIHTSHGIMLQEVTPESGENVGGTHPEVQSVSKTGERSLKLAESQSLPDCYLSQSQRKSPTYTVIHSTSHDGEEAFQNSNQRTLIWSMIRMLSSQSEQEVPSWGGFISLTGEKPAAMTTIDYYPVINHPITDYKAVQECLRYAEEGTKKVGQTYVITTFDLGVCMKAYPLVFSRPIKYKNHIIMIGTFHIICAYFKMVGHKMNGSGLSDVLMEAGLIASGSLNGVMNGKHYSRAINCHKITVEALERLLMEKFLAKKREKGVFESLHEQSKRLLKEIIDAPGKDTEDAVLHDESISAYLNEYVAFRDGVRDGSLGKTGQFWMSYMDHVSLVLALIQAVKRNDFRSYCHCLFLMPDIFFSFGGQNYARYLTFFSIFMANIEETHPGATALLQQGAISVARSFIPGNRSAVDKTIEETIMKHAKSHGGAGGCGVGLSGILSNHEAYQRWVKTTHERTLYVDATFSMADMLSESTEGAKHRDLRPSEILRSEKSVLATCEAIKSFIDPFAVDDNDRLYNISSGAPVPAAIEADVMRAESVGKTAKEEFIKDRLEKKEKFFLPIKRLNLKTMANMNKSVKLKTNNKVVEYKQQGNVALQLLVHSQSEDGRLDLRSILAYPLTPVPYSIATADGFFAKTDKSKGYHFLIKDLEDEASPPPETTLVIEDGNAMFYYMQQVPSNFRKISTKVFDMMPKNSDVVFSTDMYLENSIKSNERQRRGSSDKLIIKGDSTKRPADWKLFLANEENKQQFIQVMCNVWSSNAFASKMHNRNIIFICEERAFLFTSEDGNTTIQTEIDTLKSTQEETDSRVILYCNYAKEMGYQYVCIKSPDTDIFFIALHFALQLDGIIVLFDSGKKIINLSELANSYTQDQCTALMGLHAFTRCDTTSAFKGIGKVKPIKKMQKMPKFVQFLANMGVSWDVSDALINGLEEFTCALYGRPRITSVNDLRYQMLIEKCGDDGKINPSLNIDMANMPPCRQCLVQHIKRSNYQVAIWKRANIAVPDLPNPTDGHGWTLHDGKIEPLWVDGDVLPLQLETILEKVAAEGTDDEDEDGDVELYEYNSSVEDNTESEDSE